MKLINDPKEKIQTTNYKLKCFTTSTITKPDVLSISNHFHKVHDHKWQLFTIFWSIKFNMAKNIIYSGPNENGNW